MWWIPTIIAVMAIIAGYPQFVIGKPEVVGNLGETVGTWTIENDVDVAIKVHCYKQTSDLGTTTLDPTQIWFRQWIINPNYNEVYTCDFEWDSLNGSKQQSFIIWAHDAPHSFLQTCFRCMWKVGQGGFYFQQTDGQYVLEWKWN